jgi:hypothetical protein
MIRFTATSNRKVVIRSAEEQWHKSIRSVGLMLHWTALRNVKCVQYHYSF